MRVKITKAEHWYKVNEEFEVEPQRMDANYFQLKEYPEKHKIPVIKKVNCTVMEE